MSAFTTVNGHRVFSDDICEHAGHKKGDRHGGGIGLLQEWTGDIWAPVCPVDDVPMQGRDIAGWLICQVCRCTYTELVKAVRS